MILKTVNASEFQGVRYTTKRGPKGVIKRKSRRRRDHVPCRIFGNLILLVTNT